MSLSKAIYKILSSESELTDLTSTRIFPSVIPQNVDYPALMYEINSEEPMYVKSRKFQKVESHIVIGVHGKTYADVQNVSDVVISILDKYVSESLQGISGVPNSAGCSIVEGYWIQEVFFDNSFDLFDEKLRVFEKYIEFDVRYIINPGSMGVLSWYTSRILETMSSSSLGVSGFPPTPSVPNVAAWFNSGGASSQNLLDESAFRPEYLFSDEALEFRLDVDSALGTASNKEFTNGNTMFIVFEGNIDTSYTQFYLPIINDELTSSLTANAIQLILLPSGSYQIRILINGNIISTFTSQLQNFINKKCFFAFSWGGSNDENGQYQLLCPSASPANVFNAQKQYYSISSVGAGNFKFQFVGTNVAGTTVGGSGNQKVKIFDIVMLEKKLTFGGAKYNQIKEYLLNKNNLL